MGGKVSKTIAFCHSSSKLSVLKELIDEKLMGYLDINGLSLTIIFFFFVEFIKYLTEKNQYTYITGEKE